MAQPSEFMPNSFESVDKEFTSDSSTQYNIELSDDALQTGGQKIKSGHSHFYDVGGIHTFNVQLDYEDNGDINVSVIPFT